MACHKSRHIGKLPGLATILFLTISAACAGAADIHSNSSTVVNNPATFTIDLSHVHEGMSHGIDRFKRSAPSDGNFVPPDDDDEIQMLKDQIKELENTIRRLESSASADSEDKNLISILKTSLESVKRELDSERKNVRQLTEQINSLSRAINSMHQKYLPYACVEDIENRRFDAALAKLDEIVDKEKSIENIVKRVYANLIQNFNLLLDFGKVVVDVDLKLSIYKTLDYEMRVNNNTDIVKILDLASAVKTEIIDSSQDGDVKKKANSLWSNLKDSVDAIVPENVKRAMREDNSESKETITAISNYLNGIEAEKFNTLIKKIVGLLYVQEELEKIIEFIDNLQHAEWHAGYGAVFDEMKKRNDQNSPVVMRFAIRIRNSRNKNKLTHLWGQMPSSAAVLAFEPDIVIQNVLTSNVLYKKYEETSKDVSLWTGRYWWLNVQDMSREMPNDQIWEIEAAGKYFTIRGQWIKEYIYESADNRAKTSVTKEEGSTWELVPVSKGVKIRNVKSGHVLYLPKPDSQSNTEPVGIFNTFNNFESDSTVWLLDKYSSEWD